MSAAAHFEAVHRRAVEAAAGVGGFVDFDLRIGPAAARFRFAGGALVPRLTPALAHLRAPPAATPDLTLLLFDEASTGTPMVPAPVAPDGLRRHGEVPALAPPGGYAHYNVYHHAWTLLDGAGRGIYWIADAARVPDHETASPLFALFHAWLSPHGLHHVHAAGTGRAEGGVLLVGGNGAGKSNAVLACAGAGLGFAGDDRVLLAADPEPTLYSLYCTAKTRPEDVARIPWLAGRAGELGRLGNGKLLYDLARLAPGALLRSFPIRAVVTPRVVAGPGGSVRPGDAAAALRQLAPYTMLRWPSFGPATLRTLARVFRAVPCWELECGPDRSEIPKAIERILDAGHR